MFLNSSKGPLSNVEIFAILNEIKGSVENNPGKTLTIGIGNSYESVKDYKKSFIEALTALDSRFIMGTNKLIHINNTVAEKDIIHPAYPFDLEENIMFSIKTLNSREAVNHIEKISGIYLAISGGNKDKIKNLFVELITILLRNMKEVNLDAEINEKKDMYISEILLKNTYEELKQYMINLTNMIISNLLGKFKSREQSTIDTIKSYINQHFIEDISLKTLSGIVYMNPSYLSNFFKNCTGKNISDYLLETRMNKAVEYLLQSDIKVYEIAGMVGYSDPRRFSDAFRKYSGMNPNEYKLKLKKPLK